MLSCVAPAWHLLLMHFCLQYSFTGHPGMTVRLSAVPRPGAHTEAAKAQSPRPSAYSQTSEAAQRLCRSASQQACTHGCCRIGWRHCYAGLVCAAGRHWPCHSHPAGALSNATCSAWQCRACVHVCSTSAWSICKHSGIGMCSASLKAMPVAQNCPADSRQSLCISRM